MTKIFKKLKLIFKKNIFIILSLIIIIIFFINSSYALLEKDHQIIGNTTIKEGTQTGNICPGYLSFKKIANWNSTYTYQIFINNSSNEDFEQWELSIYNPGLITFPSWFEGEKTPDGWILKDNGSNRFISKNSSISTIITFDISDIKNMTQNEYADYFVNNFVFFTGCGTSTINGQEITNKNAKITLGMYEEKLNYELKKNNNYIPTNNETEYILTINNPTSKRYLKIRGNIYLGNSEILSIAPFTITNKTNTDITFESLYGYLIEPNSEETIYFTVNEVDNITPEIIIVGLIDV